MTITVEFDADTGAFQLWVSDGRMAPMPAGPRLFRGNPPQIEFEHAEFDSAAADAKTLGAYLDALEPAKRLTKRQIAEVGA